NMSGNGWHLLARIPPQDPATFPEHLEAFLADVAGKLSDGQVDVDAVLFDAPRIIKIPGHVSVKGENTKERPWRRATIARWTDPAPDAAQIGRASCRERAESDVVAANSSRKSAARRR